MCEGCRRAVSVQVWLASARFFFGEVLWDTSNTSSKVFVLKVFLVSPEGCVSFHRLISTLLHNMRKLWEKRFKWQYVVCSAGASEKLMYRRILWQYMTQNHVVIHTTESSDYTYRRIRWLYITWAPVTILNAGPCDTTQCRIQRQCMMWDPVTNHNVGFSDSAWYRIRWQNIP